jgi:hypothetical protein
MQNWILCCGRMAMSANKPIQGHSNELWSLSQRVTQHWQKSITFRISFLIFKRNSIFAIIYVYACTGQSNKEPKCGSLVGIRSIICSNTIICHQSGNASSVQPLWYCRKQSYWLHWLKQIDRESCEYFVGILCGAWIASYGDDLRNTTFIPGI